MRAKVFKDQLSKVLSKVKFVVNAGEPYFSTRLYMRTEDDKLILKSVNSELSLTYKIPANVGGIGEVVVDIFKLRDIVNNSPERELNFYLEDNELVIKSGRTTFRLSTFPVENLAKIYSFSKKPLFQFTLPAEVMKEAIQKTAYAVATSIFKGVFCNLYICRKGNEIHFVGSDNHRLALFIYPQTTPMAEDVLIPQPALDLLYKLLENTKGYVSISASKKFIAISNDEFKLVIKQRKRRQGKYPNYWSLINSLQERVNYDVSIYKHNFYNALKRASLISKEVVLRFKSSKLKIMASNNCKEKFSETLEIEGEADFQASFYTKYLLDIVGHIDDVVIRIKIVDNDSPIILEADTLALITSLKM